MFITNCWLFSSYLMNMQTVDTRRAQAQRLHGWDVSWPCDVVPSDPRSALPSSWEWSVKVPFIWFPLLIDISLDLTMRLRVILAYLEGVLYDNQYLFGNTLSHVWEYCSAPLQCQSSNWCLSDSRQVSEGLDGLRVRMLTAEWCWQHQGDRILGG